MKQLTVTDEAHAAAKLAAESAGTSMVAWASERLTAPAEYYVTSEDGQCISGPFSEASPPPWPVPAGYWVDLGPIPDVRLSAMASARSQSPAETLSAALDALERPSGIVVPAAPDPHRAPWERK